MNRIQRAVAGALLLVSSLCAAGTPATSASLAGTWFGEVALTHPDGKVSHDAGVLLLAQQGSTFTGSIGGSVDQQSPISQGRLENGWLLFHLDAAGGLDFRLRLHGQRLEGTAAGQQLQAVVTMRRAPGLLPHAQLVQEISEADRKAFEAFGSCDIDGYAAFLSKDLEFYHDRTGRVGYDRSLALLRQRCQEGIFLRRELVKESIVINSVPGFGAIEAGIHRFYQRQPDGSEQLDATARFTMVWINQEGGWKLARVVSFDHE